MLDLLIAILIALGCNVATDWSQEEIEANYSSEYQKAKEIYETNSYRTGDGGGVVILEVVGD